MNKQIALFTLFFAICMTNIGLSKNLSYTFLCAQYYVDYFVFFGLGYVLYSGIQYSLKRNFLPKRKKLSIVLFMIIAVYSFDAFYAFITGCDFNSVFFLSSKTPIVSAYAVSILFLIPSVNVRKSDSFWVKRIDGALTCLEEKRITAVEYRNQITQVCLDNNTEILISESLKSLMQRLDLEQFYRANRNSIIRKAAIDEVFPVTNKGIEVILVNGSKTFINKNNTSHFKKWMKT